MRYRILTHVVRRSRLSRQVGGTKMFALNVRLAKILR